MTLLEIKGALVVNVKYVTDIMVCEVINNVTVFETVKSVIVIGLGVFCLDFK